jgi:hypothetical protein
MLSVRKTVFAVVAQGKGTISGNAVGNKVRAVHWSIEDAVMARNVALIDDDRIVAAWFIGKAQVRVEISDGAIYRWCLFLIPVLSSTKAERARS